MTDVEICPYEGRTDGLDHICHVACPVCEVALCGETEFSSDEFCNGHGCDDCVVCDSLIDSDVCSHCGCLIHG